jgi:hypothetical protein
MQEKDCYTIDKQLVTKVTEKIFNTSEHPEAWGKDRLISVKLLSEVFNSYLDVAEETLNFTQLDNLPKEKESDFKIAIAKNLLFTLKVIAQNESSIDETISLLIDQTNQQQSF